MDCPPSELCSGTLGEGLERNEVVGRLELIDGLDRSTDRLGWLGLTEILGGAVLTDGADRSIEGLGRLIDGLCLLGLIDGLGATGAGRLPAIRSRRPPPDRFDWGAGIIDGLRLICGLGADRNDGVPTDPLRFIIEG